MARDARLRPAVVRRSRPAGRPPPGCSLEVGALEARHLRGASRRPRGRRAADAPGEEPPRERAVGDVGDAELPAGAAGSRPPGRAGAASTRSGGRRWGAPRGRGGGSRRRPRRGRCGAPCPASTSRPSRRPTPRSAPRRQPGAGSRRPRGPRPGAPGCARRPPGQVLRCPAARLGREHDLVAAAGDRAPDQLLVAALAVGLGGVDQGDAAVERAVDRPHALVVLGGAVVAGEAHRAEADGTHLRPVRSQSPVHARTRYAPRTDGRPGGSSFRA